MKGENIYQKRFKELCSEKRTENILISEYSDKILNLIKDSKKMTNSDIQGVSEAIIKMVIEKCKS